MCLGLGIDRQIVKTALYRVFQNSIRLVKLQGLDAGDFWIFSKDVRMEKFDLDTVGPLNFFIRGIWRNAEYIIIRHSNHLFLIVGSPRLRLVGLTGLAGLVTHLGCFVKINGSDLAAGDLITVLAVIAAPAPGDVHGGGNLSGVR